MAGPAALLVAKLIKIDDRTGTDRHTDKDALDIVRLLRGVPTEDLTARMNRVLADTRSTNVATRAIDLLRQKFGRQTDEGVQMAVRAGRGRMDSSELAVSTQMLCGDLLEALRR